MTPAEYQQLKAFARIDGALLAMVWIGSFALYVKGLDNPTLGLISMVALITAPFFVARRLRKFRDFAREGIISFRRAYAYIIYTFFYSGLLLALAQFMYFNYMDHGYLLSKFTEIANTQESVQLGLKDMMQEGLNKMASMRPIDYSLNVLTIVIIAGFVLGMPIAALVQKKQGVTGKEQEAEKKL